MSIKNFKFFIKFNFYNKNCVSGLLFETVLD